MAEITLPHNIEAEKAILGYALLRGVGVGEWGVRPEYFYGERHQKICEVIDHLDGLGNGIDLVTASDLLALKTNLVKPAYLSELVDACPVTLNIQEYAKIVKSCYTRRRIVRVCHDTIQSVLGYSGNDTSFLEDVEKELLEATGDHEERGLVQISDIVPSVMEELERRAALGGELTGIPTGFSGLDNITGGWQKSDLIILAARPGMGKTALALDWAVAAARSNFKTAIFSMEMSENQLVMRRSASDAMVNSSKLRRGGMNEDETDRVMNSMRRLHDLHSLLSIDETPALTLSQIRSRCRRAKRKTGLDLVIIDYLQLMTGSSRSRAQSREREISEISRGLKALAKELDIAVVSLAQLNRSPDSRPDKRPRMSDLRESGSIEQDADIVQFIYRDEYYHRNSEDGNKAELIVSKNRHGPMATIELAFLHDFVTFKTLEIDSF